MKNTVPAQISRPARRFGASSLALVLTAASTLPLLASPGSNPAEHLAAPPDFPDEVHVMNGCYISTAVYVGKFLNAFPGERAEPLTVRPQSYEGPHTLALVSWRGQWWARDEYFGVFALNCATHTGSIPFQIGRRAQEALDRHATRRAGAGEIEFAATRRRVPAFQWADEADNAARLLPFATERFWVESEGQKILMLCFHPTPGEIAVYNPATGTTQARCASTDGAEIVAAVAARIGYRVDAVQRETAADPAILMASAESMPGEISR